MYYLAFFHTKKYTSDLNQLIESILSFGLRIDSSEFHSFISTKSIPEFLYLDVVLSNHLVDVIY